MSERFSWIIPNRLAVGSFPTQSYEISYLSRAGITSVLCLTEPQEIPVPQQVYNRFVWRNIAIPDGATGGVPKVEQFQQACAILSRWHHNGHVVYVHCLAGVGRAPSICIAYLAQMEGISLQEALGKVQERHPPTYPDSAQIEVLQAFLALSQEEKANAK
ncbi:MAG: phosphatase [Cyanobacteria bacterium SW_9_44_58]|nr:MAG: phosphatase [Cyanobacteria bacterium SW_9_44_58]